MIRRRLLIFFVGLVGLLALVAVAAIWLLQGVLADLDHTGREDAVVAESANRMSETITLVEIELREVQRGQQKHLDALIDTIEVLDKQLEAFGAEYQRPIPEGAPIYKRITTNLKAFKRNIGMLATAQDQEIVAAHMDVALAASVALRQDILLVSRMMREHVTHEQAQAVAWFRWLVLALAIVFLLMINIAVVVLLRMSSMVLRPVDRLVDASRRLGAEEFDFRVAQEEGEFGELAGAFNRLAEELQGNERRKLETLAQTAVMLNHELNNASAIIKLQLQLMQRQAGGNPGVERGLRQINESLARMTATVEALKHIRRIVLTDYDQGTKMLDLQKSVAEEPTAV